MENQLLYQVFEIATAFFETFIVYIYLEGLFLRNNRQTKNNKWYIGFSIGLAALSLYFRTGLVLIIYILLGVYIIASTCYKTSASSRIIATFYFAGVMMIAEIIAGGLVTYVWNMTVPAILVYSLPRVLGALIAKLIQAAMVKLTVTLTNWKATSLSKEELKMLIPPLFCQLFSLGLAYYIAMISVEFYTSFSLLALFAMLGLMYINSIAFWYFDRIKLVYELKGKNEAAEYKLV